MSMKSVCLGGLVVTLLGLGVVRGQGPGPSQGAPYYSGSMSGSMGSSMGGGGSTLPPVLTTPADTPPATTGVAHLSSWITYPRAPGCCGPLGANGPIGSDVYLRTGISIPTGSGPLGNSLETGWEIQGGGRLLLFNPAVDAAWIVDLSVSNVQNHASDRTRTVTLVNVPAFGGATILPTLDVSPAALNRTYVNFGIGREWWLLGSADNCHDLANWRAGIDVGGRYGTAKLEFNEIRHTTDVIGGFYLAVHTDLEIPCGGCIFLAGIRGEYSYTWSDILQRQNDADIQEISILFSLGARF
jgi:hypothetical protein